jgi:hypothetical protein
MTLNPKRMAMPRKKYTPEQNIARLSQIEVPTGQGQSLAHAVREAGISVAECLEKGRIE